MDSRCFFIVGCQRTGTTLMQLMLECHSRIHCVGETNGYQVLSGSLEYHLPPEKDVLGFKIPRWTEQLDHSRLSDFEQTFEAKRFYTDQPIVFMLRDVRDCVASMLNLRAGQVSWLETWAVPITDHKIRTSQQFGERFEADIDLIRSAEDPKLLHGALYWKYKTLAFFDYRAKAWPVLGVRYEQLVSRPDIELKRVTDFLAVDWEPGMLEHPRFPHAELLPDGRAVGGTDPQRSIDAQSIGQWERILSAEQVGDILRIAGGVNERILDLR